MPTLITGFGAAATMCDAFVDLIDSGAGNGSLKLYTGAVPATPSESLAGKTLLATFDFLSTAFGDASQLTGQAVANPIASVNAAADGTASFALVLDGDGIAIAVADVGDAESTASIKLNTTTVVAGGLLTVVSFKITHPTGG
jgi:hypothetical protein